MAHFPPIDVATVCAEPVSKVEASYTQKAREALKHLAKYDGTHDYPYCWGYTIFRTVYTPGSDERVAAAVERLAVDARHFVTRDLTVFPPPLGGVPPFDTRPSEELMGRYYSELVEEEQSLAGLSESEVGERFDAWIAQHRAHPGRERNTRFAFCLMLDEESLANILALPQEPHGHGLEDEDEGEGYVKVISDRMKTEDEPGAAGRYWLRVGVFDFLWSMFFFPCDSDILIEEMGVYDPEDGIQNLWGTYQDWDRENMAMAGVY